jgi:hypothetical protein
MQPEEASFDLNRGDVFSISCALEMQFDMVLGDVRNILKTLKKIDPAAAKRALDELLDSAAAFGSVVNDSAA